MNSNESVMLPIGKLFNIEKGSLQSSKCIQGKYPFITAAEQWKSHNNYLHDCEALLFEMGAAGSLGRTHYVHDKFTGSDLCFILTPAAQYKGRLDLKFYYYIFNFLRSEIVASTATGTSKLAINITNFGRYQLPYFDLPRQAELKDIFVATDEIKNQLVRESQKQSVLIAALRQAILQLAVKGRLVPQNPKDEPASVLLKKIRVEKEKLIKEGKFKQTKPLSPTNPKDMPYELPDGWEWVRLGEAYDVRDGTHDSPKYVKTGYPLVTSKNIYGSRLDLTSVKFISEADHRAICQRSGVDQMDILFAMIGSIGNPVIVDVEAEFSIKNVALFKYYDRKLSSPKYLRYYLSYAEEEMKKRAAGGVQAFISLSYLRNYLIPIPPLYEQKRIVAEVDQLMALCDELEAKLKQSRFTAETLMGAVVNELTMV